MLAEAFTCKFIELRTVVEFYFVETTFIFGINLLVAVPTTLRSVWFASYPSSKGWFSLDHKRNVSDGVVSGVGRNGNALDFFDPDSIAVMTPLTTPTPTTSLVKTRVKSNFVFGDHGGFA